MFLKYLSIFLFFLSNLYCANNELLKPDKDKSAFDFVMQNHQNIITYGVVVEIDKLTIIFEKTIVLKLREFKYDNCVKDEDSDSYECPMLIAKCDCGTDTTLADNRCEKTTLVDKVPTQITYTATTKAYYKWWIGKVFHVETSSSYWNTWSSNPKGLGYCPSSGNWGNLHVPIRGNAGAHTTYIKGENTFYVHCNNVSNSKTCPDGGTLSGDTCTKSVSVCPEGTTEYSATQCIQKTVYVPEGYNNEQCIKLNGEYYSSPLTCNKENKCGYGLCYDGEESTSAVNIIPYAQHPIEAIQRSGSACNAIPCDQEYEYSDGIATQEEVKNCENGEVNKQTNRCEAPVDCEGVMIDGECLAEVDKVSNIVTAEKVSKVIGCKIEEMNSGPVYIVPMTGSLKKYYNYVNYEWKIKDANSCGLIIEKATAGRDVLTEYIQQGYASSMATFWGTGGDWLNKGPVYGLGCPDGFTDNNGICEKGSASCPNGFEENPSTGKCQAWEYINKVDSVTYKNKIDVTEDSGWIHSANYWWGTSTEIPDGRIVWSGSKIYSESNMSSPIYINGWYYHLRSTEGTRTYAPFLDYIDGAVKRTRTVKQCESGYTATTGAETANGECKKITSECPDGDGWEDYNSTQCRRLKAGITKCEFEGFEVDGVMCVKPLDEDYTYYTYECPSDVNVQGLEWELLADNTPPGCIDDTFGNCISFDAQTAQCRRQLLTCPSGYGECALNPSSSNYECNYQFCNEGAAPCYDKVCDLAINDRVTYCEQRSCPEGTEEKDGKCIKEECPMGTLEQDGVCIQR